jgi:hypothetical protein
MAPRIRCESRCEKMPTLWLHMAHTCAWLANQRYTISAGSHPFERLPLTDKGLAALNAVPSNLQVTRGTSLVVARDSRDLTSIGDLIGGIFGGFTKSMGSG